jgi:nucleoid-associated protein YgaU
VRYTFSKSSLLAGMFVLSGMFVGCSSTEDQGDEISEAIEEEVQIVDDESEESNPLSEISAQEFGDSEAVADQDNAIADSYKDISQPESPIDAELDSLTGSPENAGQDPELSMPVSDTGIAPKMASNSVEVGLGIGEYIVQPGDTLSRIAFNIFGKRSKWAELAAENEIVNPERILPGDVIKYQVTDSSQTYQNKADSLSTSIVVVEKGDTLSKIATRLLGNSSYWRSIWRLNQSEIPNPHRLKVGQELRYIEPNKYRSAFKSTGSSKTGH